MAKEQNRTADDRIIRVLYCLYMVMIRTAPKNSHLTYKIVYYSARFGIEIVFTLTECRGRHERSQLIYNLFTFYCHLETFIE